MKGAPFLSKMVYKGYWIRSGGGATPYKIFCIAQPTHTHTHTQTPSPRGGYNEMLKL